MALSRRGRERVDAVAIVHRGQGFAVRTVEQHEIVLQFIGFDGARIERDDIVSAAGEDRVLETAQWLLSSKSPVFTE